MGCGSSRPVDHDSAQQETESAPQIRHSPQGITSQTAFNHVSSERQRTTLEPPSLASLHQSNLSHSAISTPRLSSTNSRSQSHPVDLTEHYNLPLQSPKSWTSKDRVWTRAQIQRERNEFFETRTTGRQEIWNAIRLATECIWEGDLISAQGILDAAGVTLPTGRLEEGGYDESGALYKLSNVILSDPMNIVEDDNTLADQSYESIDKATSLSISGLDSDLQEGDSSPETTKVDKGKAVLENDAIKVKCRLSDRGGPDVVVLLGKNQNIATLIGRVKDDVEISNKARVRVAYMGRILDERRPLIQQGWKEGHVVNVLIAGNLSK